MIKKLNSATKQPQNGHGVSHFRNNQKYYMITSTKQKEIAKLNMLLLIERQKKSCPEKKKMITVPTKNKKSRQINLYGILRRDDVNHRTEK